MPPDSTPRDIHVIDERRTTVQGIDFPTLFGIDLDGDGCGFAWHGVGGDVVFLPRQKADVLAEIMIVEPHFAIAIYARDDQKCLTSGPSLWNLDLAFVPAFADEIMAHFFGFRAVALVVPDARHANRAVGRRRVTGQRHGRQLCRRFVPFFRPRRDCRGRSQTSTRRRDSSIHGPPQNVWMSANSTAPRRAEDLWIGGAFEKTRLLEILSCESYDKQQPRHPNQLLCSSNVRTLIRRRQRLAAKERTDHKDENYTAFIGSCALYVLLRLNLFATVHFPVFRTPYGRRWFVARS